MARAGLSTEAVTRAALGIVDEEGPEALTLARVAAVTGVATPSLYKHVDGLPRLRKLVAIEAIRELSGRLSEAVRGRSGGKAVRALMLAYRDYAVERPHRYQMIPQKLRQDPELVAVADEVLHAIVASLREFELDGPRLIHAARSMRVAAHGFATLQASGGFQLAENVDESYEIIIDMIINGVARLSGDRDRRAR
jgi:AcrR family transcriptional regulator